MAKAKPKLDLSKLKDQSWPLIIVAVAIVGAVLLLSANSTTNNQPQTDDQQLVNQTQPAVITSGQAEGFSEAIQALNGHYHDDLLAYYRAVKDSDAWTHDSAFGIAILRQETWLELQLQYLSNYNQQLTELAKTYKINLADYNPVIGDYSDADSSQPTPEDSPAWLADKARIAEAFGLEQYHNQRRDLLSEYSFAEFYKLLEDLATEEAVSSDSLNQIQLNQVVDDFNQKYDVRDFSARWNQLVDQYNIAGYLELVRKTGHKHALAPQSILVNRDGRDNTEVYQPFGFGDDRVILPAFERYIAWTFDYQAYNQALVELNLSHNHQLTEFYQALRDSDAWQANQLDQAVYQSLQDRYLADYNQQLETISESTGADLIDDINFNDGAASRIYWRNAQRSGLLGGGSAYLAEKRKVMEIFGVVANRQQVEALYTTYQINQLSQQYHDLYDVSPRPVAQLNQLIADHDQTYDLAEFWAQKQILVAKTDVYLDVIFKVKEKHLVASLWVMAGDEFETDEVGGFILNPQGFFTAQQAIGDYLDNKP